MKLLSPTTIKQKLAYHQEIKWEKLTQCNPSAMSDLQENTSHTTRDSEQDSMLVVDGGVELAEKKPPGVTCGSNLVGPGVSVKGTPLATSCPK